MSIIQDCELLLVPFLMNKWLNNVKHKWTNAFTKYFQHQGLNKYLPKSLELNQKLNSYSILWTFQWTRQFTIETLKKWFKNSSLKFQYLKLQLLKATKGYRWKLPRVVHLHYSTVLFFFLSSVIISNKILTQVENILEKIQAHISSAQYWITSLGTWERKDDPRRKILKNGIDLMFWF